MAAALSAASIKFHTDDDDKDADTHVTVEVRDEQGRRNDAPVLVAPLGSVLLHEIDDDFAVSLPTGKRRKSRTLST